MEPITITISETTKVIGVGRTKVYELIAQRRLIAIRLDGRTLVRMDSVRQLIHDLSSNV
jgi:excisionase family DNA binding protein